MSGDNKGFQRIKADEAVNALGWNLPQMDVATDIGLQRKNPVEVTVVEEVIAAEKITVAELEAIRESARLDGLSAGLEEGRSKGVEEGKQEGLLSGRDAGYKEGYKQGEAEVQRLQGLFSGMLAELEKPLEDTTQLIEEKLLQLVVGLSEAVVGAELSTRKDLLLDSIREALQQLPDPIVDVSIHINSDDKVYLESLDLLPGVEIELLEDDSLQAGGYRINTSNTLVQHDVESRFADVVKQFSHNTQSKTPDSHE